MDDTKVEGGAELNVPESIKELPEVGADGSADNGKKQETVPLSVYLALKEDVKELKRDLKESTKGSKNSGVDVSELAKKYPDVSPEFIQDFLESATSKAKQEALTEVESKYDSVIKKQQLKEEQDKFDQDFERVFNKAVSDNPDLPKNINKELIKTLVLTPKYKDKKVAEILAEIYPDSASGKPSSENETVASVGSVETISDFSRITPEQKKAVMADDKARAAYFNWLDKQPG